MSACKGTNNRADYTYSTLLHTYYKPILQIDSIYNIEFELIITFCLLLVWDLLRCDRYSPSSAPLCSCYSPHLLEEDPLRCDKCSPFLAYVDFYHCFHLSVEVPLTHDKHDPPSSFLSRFLALLSSLGVGPSKT